MSNRNTSLHRPDDGRWLAGVAAGLSLRLGVSVWIVRIVFAALCFAGGLGALLYLTCWLLIPREGETRSIAQGWLAAGQAGRWVGVVLVGLAAIILVSEIGFIRGDLAFAVVLIGIGILLYRGDLSGGDSRPATTRATDQETSPEEAVEAQAVSPVPAPPPVQPRERSYLGRVFAGVAVVALGVLGLLDTSVGGFHPEFHHYVALAVGVVGLGLVVGAWFGRPGGLILLGLLLIPILVVSRAAAAGGVDFTSIEFTSVGNVHHRPGSVEAIRQEYGLGIGSLTIDLREVDFEGRTVELETQVGIGEVNVRLPEGVAAEVSGQVGVGALEVGDWDYGGFGVEADLLFEGASGTLVLDANVGLGQIEVDGWPVEDRVLYSRSTRRGEDAAIGDDHDYRIRDAADLRDHYTLAAGSLRLDLGDLVLEDDRSVRIDVDGGEVWVTVPRDLSLVIAARVDRGRLTLFDEVLEGPSVKTTYAKQVFGASRLTLDIDLGKGTVIVEDER